MASQSRGRSNGQGTAKKPQKRFQFIDNSNVGSTGANSTQVRRHVMQEYMREKRWQKRAKAETSVPASDDNSESEVVTSSQPNENFDALLRRDVASSFQPNRGLKRVHPGDVQLSTSPHEGQLRHQPQPSSRQPIGPFDMIEEIPRTFPLVEEPRSKRYRRGFYLTPQSFAQVADLLPSAPLTPPLSVSSLEECSPSIWSDGCSSHGTDVTSPLPLVDPVSWLSAARTDPFDCLPMTLSEQDQELFDFYATVMPACSYGFERRSPKAHNWYLSVFIPEAMKSPVAFQNTVLVHAANTQAWVRGLAETPLAIEHRARASEMLLSHFRKYPLDTSDAAISSTLSAAALEDFDPRIERREYAWIHWKAAVQKIRDRGGPIALQQNRSLRILINWSDYIFSGYNGYGSTFFFDHGSSPGVASGIEAETLGRREIAQQCEELIIFLKCAEHLAAVAANLQHNPSTCRDQPLRYSVLQPNQPLYNLLASPNGPRYTKTGQLKQIISRLAALMTINVAIWEYRYSVAASEEFFRELSENIRHNELDKNISVEALIQIMLSGSDNPVLLHTERPWLVGRLLKVAKRLSRASWERLNDFLLQCLTLDYSVPVPRMNDWEHELRAEILSAPLASYVLPLVKGP